MNNEKQWIEEMRKRMEDYSEPLPEELWKEIEAELNAPKVIPFKRIWQSAAVILVLFVSSLTIWFWSAPDTDLTTQKESVRETAETPEEHIDIQQPYVAQPSPANSLLSTEKSLALLSPSERTETLLPYSHEATDIPDLSDNDQPAAFHMGTPDKKNECNEKKQGPVTRTLKANRDADRRQMQKNAETLRLREKQKTAKFGFGINSGNIPYSSTNDYIGMGRLAMASSHDVIDFSNVLNDKQMAYSQVLFENRELNPVTRINHHVPITVGATFRWEFTKDWSLETGIMYTLLVSELSSGENAYVEEEQRLHYVGIPLKLQRSIWNNNRFNLYASAGGAVEKCVSGKVSTKYISASGWQETENTSLEVRQLQWSVSAGVGAQVNFTPQVGLYVEPGIAYYFDDNSPVETIRKEHPFNFNLQMGLRFSVKQ